MHVFYDCASAQTTQKLPDRHNNSISGQQQQPKTRYLILQTQTQNNKFDPSVDGPEIVSDVLFVAL